jgi:2-oxoglutarate ferredoxin oxidoreductase subunit beta
MPVPKEELKKVWSLPNRGTFIQPQAAHHMCPGCGEPMVYRIIAELMDEMNLRERVVYVPGIGCYSALGSSLKVDQLRALHGRAPSVATGVKRMLPDCFVITVQGDGDLVSEGLAEALHCSARSEKFTAILVNNTVNGETGGHMTATTLVGQKTKSTLTGRDAEIHGGPIRTAEMIAQMDGTAYSARGSVHSPVAIRRTKKMIHQAFQAQEHKLGFSFVEVMTMCPTGWFMETWEAPKYMEDVMTKYFKLGEFKVHPSLAAAPAA